MSRKTKAEIPSSVYTSHEQVHIEEPGHYLILGDTHIRYHDVKTIELAVKRAKKDRATGIILNGDIVDAHEMSDFDQDPGAPRYREERKSAIEFLTYLRQQFPKSRIIYRKGNHEERLDRYIIRRAPALFGLDAISLPQLFEFEKNDIDYVGDRRVIHLGKLAVVHGHEFRSGASDPVSPARTVFMRARQSIITSHFHRPDEYNAPTVSGKLQSAWSIGCACGLNPFWLPINNWFRGFAMVDLHSSGEFSVRNLRVLGSEVV